MSRLITTCLILGAAALIGAAGTSAQESGGTPAPVLCAVEPRSEEDLSALVATAAVATPSDASVGPEPFPAGEPVDEAIRASLDETLHLAVDCLESGDIARLLALYSDRYVTTIALAPEPVPIVPGQGHGHAAAEPVGTPEPEIIEPHQPRVDDAVRLPDGRIAALVSAEEDQEIVYFTEQNGRWVIDDVRERLPDGTLDGNQPLAVQAAVAALAGELGIDPAQVTIESVQSVDWPDTSLGCPKEGEFYAAVITPGYDVVLSVDGTFYSYHTDATDRAVRCDPA